MPSTPPYFPQTSDDQFAALLQMEDLGGMERKMRRQEALSNQLRSTALQPSSGKDWASQLARGMQGGMAGYAMGREQPMIDQYGAAKKANVGKALEFLRNKQRMGGNVQAPMQTNEELTGIGY